jgi:hypothetical protein
MDTFPTPESGYFSFPHGLTIAGRLALGAFPSLLLGGRAYNRWLTEEILDTVLRRWSGGPADGAEAGTGVDADVEWACGRGRLAFHEILPAAAALGDPAVLVTMGVTANLQRSLALLGELILDETPPGRVRPPLRFSRCLCGLADYPEGSPYFAGRIRPPVHAARLRAGRPDPRYLGNALWCSEREINRCCEEALDALGRQIRSDGCFTPDDLRHLHAGCSPSRFR